MDLTCRPLRQAGAAALLAAGLPTAGAVPALAQTPTPDGGCENRQGVTVVVDLGDGTIRLGCATADPATGLDALRRAGFVYQINGAGLVCQIENTPADCPETPPPDRFWSYWSGSDTTWAFATRGADITDPAPGDVQGWRLGDGTDTPAISPEAAREADATVTAAPASPPATPATTSGPATSAAPTSGAPAASAPAEATEEQPMQGSGTPWGVIGVLVVLVGGAGLLAWRARTARRR